MNRNALMILAVVALVAAGGAMWLSSERQAATEVKSGGALVPGLKEGLNEISAVVVEAGDQSVTLRRQDDAWVIAERDGYPADLSRLRGQLLTLAESNRLEKKTALAENYARIGVQDPGAEGAESEQLRLEGLDQPVELIIGNRSSSGPPATYVREVGEEQSWLASGRLDFPADPSQWLVKDVLNVSSKRIARVVLQQPDGSELELLKNAPEDPNFVVLEVPEGRELSAPGAGNSVATALGSLRLEDVRSVDAFALNELQTTNGIFETFDGLRVRSRAWKDGDDGWVTLQVQYDPSLVHDEEPAPEAAGDEEPSSGEEMAAEVPEATDTDEESPEEEARRLSEAVSGWAFQIPSYKYGNFTKSLEDLLKAPEDEPAEAAGDS